MFHYSVVALVKNVVPSAEQDSYNWGLYSLSIVGKFPNASVTAKSNIYYLFIKWPTIGCLKCKGEKRTIRKAPLAIIDIKSELLLVQENQYTSCPNLILNTHLLIISSWIKIGTIPRHNCATAEWDSKS